MIDLHHGDRVLAEVHKGQRNQENHTGLVTEVGERYVALRSEQDGRVHSAIPEHVTRQG